MNAKQIPIYVSYNADLESNGKTFFGGFLCITPAARSTAVEIMKSEPVFSMVSTVRLGLNKPKIKDFFLGQNQ